MDKYTYAIWRRKTSTAQVRLFEWTWKNTINWKEVSSYISRSDLFEKIFLPIKLCSMKDKVFFNAKVVWSWISSQVQAISLALSRALSKKEQNFKKVLKEAWLLTCDPRKVERKKPWKKKARKSPSWSKR